MKRIHIILVLALALSLLAGCAANQKENTATASGTEIQFSDGKIAAGYDIRHYPNLWIIGLDGKVAANHRGYGEDSLERIINDINRVLREQAALAPAAAG